MKVPEAVKRLREEAKLTQVALAQKIGSSEPSIAHFESGSRRPDPVSLVKLCRLAFDMQLYTLADAFAKELPGVREGLLITVWDKRSRVVITPPPAAKITAPSAESLTLTVDPSRDMRRKTFRSVVHKPLS